MLMVRQHSSCPEIFICGPQSPELHQIKSVVDLCPHCFVRIFPKHKVFLCFNQSKLSFFKGYKALMIQELNQHSQTQR